MALFESLFEIHIEHTYYADGRSRDFTIVPTEATSKLLQDHGLLFRSFPSGGTVLAEVTRTGSGSLNILRYPIEETCYQFMLKLKNPVFLNYTDLPFHQTREKIYYFNNLDSNVSESTRYLHGSGQVTGSDLIGFETGILSTGTPVRETARLKFTDTDIQEKRRIFNSEGEIVQFDLSGFPDGRAELWIDGTKEKIFYSSGRRSMAGIFGMVEIFHAEPVPVGYRFADDTGILSKKVYTISFEQRNTYWKYFLYDRSGQELKQPNIIKNENGTGNGNGNGVSYTFSDITPDSYPEYDKIFVSDQLIPLREEGIDSLELRQKVNGQGKAVLESLPNPGVETLKKDDSDPPNYYSEVYLYI